jgi:2,4-dienoyl-CoA reductase-like NADH-dependent reductase (Old Yellow Enzyme family)
VIGRRPLGASPKLCLYRLSRCEEMTEPQIEAKIDDFVRASLLAREAGFEFVEVGRAIVRDPDFVNKLQAGAIEASDCDHCNRCIATMEAGGLYCVTYS